MASIGRATLLALALCAALALAASRAAGATYTVLSCKDRAGAPAPANDAAGGWQPGISGGLGLDWVDRCASVSGGLEATISGTWARPVLSQVWWRFWPPRGTLIQEVSILYSGYARPFDGQNRGIIYIWGPDVDNLVAHYGEGTITPRWATRQGLHEPWIQATAECDGATGAPDCPAGTLHANVTILRSEVVLADTTPPDAGAVSGSAVTATTWRGTQTFAFPATDAGAGVYRVDLDVDGAQAMQRTIDDWDGRCVDTTNGDRVFRTPQPCLTSVDAVVPIDANALPAGEHDVTLRISDAAGNLRTVYSARKTIVPVGRRVGPDSDPAERGAANGENASDRVKLAARWAHTRRSTLTGPYGRRQVIRGRLTSASGAGVRNAQIELLIEIDGRAGGALDKGGARTRADGRFTLVLPRNASSRTLLLRYRSHVNDTVAAAERGLRLNVRAGVRLAVSPRVAARGRSVRLIGRLVGRPLPPHGKVVELQARSPGEAWITFRTIRASRSGRFATRYTFRRGGPARYLMRARVREADDYPFATGTSHAVGVRVR
jgi:hypothetical protein